MKKRHLLGCGLLLSIQLTALAEDNGQKWYLYALSDTEEKEIEIADVQSLRSITFIHNENGEYTAVRFNSKTDNPSTEYPLEEIQELFFRQQPSAIQPADRPIQDELLVDGNVVLCNEDAIGGIAEIYSIDGRKLQDIPVNSTVTPIQSFETGIYIIRYKGLTRKFTIQ